MKFAFSQHRNQMFDCDTKIVIHNVIINVTYYKIKVLQRPKIRNT